MIIIMTVKTNVAALSVIIVIECEIEEFTRNKKYIINKLCKAISTMTKPGASR